MEVVGDPSLGTPQLPFDDTKDVMKVLTSEVSVVEGCHAANGVACAEGASLSTDELLHTQQDPLTKLSEVTFMEIMSNSEGNQVDNELNEALTLTETPVTTLQQGDAAMPTLDQAETKADSIEAKHEYNTAEAETVASNGVDSYNETVISSNALGVTLETEIVVEHGDAAAIADEESLPNNHEETDSTKSILSHLERQSADTNDAVENNNSNVKQEMFNQEELLDILQGNDTKGGSISGNNEYPNVLHREAQLALKQLSSLRKTKPRGKRANPKPKVIRVSKASNENKNNIVTSLVMDWEDEEDGNANEPKETAKEIPLDIECENVSNEVVVGQDDSVAEVSAEVVNEDQETTAVATESVPEPATPDPTQRRRVIKKKVPFDPDNPDTFTKAKTPKIKEHAPPKIKEPATPKSKEPATPKIKELATPKTKEQATPKTKEHPTPVTTEETPEKKIKPETTPRKSKSPVAKTQWKKPTPKNAKTCHKRLTEVDRLLMDEGAVNMIADVTPEATQGKKSMRNKAEMIKNFNQTTTDAKGTEGMKFRERKKEVKTEEDTKKVGSKQRPSLSSLKSSAAGEDFETHSADDSIIYRRHSSSSYSSACMSPRQMSEGDNLLGSVPAVEPIDKSITTVESTDHEDESMAAPDLVDQIKKEDCLSLKEKLNSRLSNAFNKRKSEDPKTPKSSKQRKRNAKAKAESSPALADVNFKTLSISFESSLAIIKLGNTGLPNNAYNVAALEEFEQALTYVDSRLDVAVTLLISESSTICPVLDLKPLLSEDPKVVATYALELTGWIRSLLLAVEQHTKLLIVGVSGAVHGLGFSVLLLADLVLASEHSVLHVSSNENLPCPGASVFTLNQRNLPQNLINDLVLFSRKLSATEAMRYGVVSRIPLPNRLLQEVYNVARDMAAQPKHSILLKKRLLRVSTTGDRETSALSNCLLAEQDLFVEFWSAAGNKTLLRSYVENMQESFLGSL